MPLGARGRYAPQNTFLETLAKKFDGTNSNFVLGNAQRNNDYRIVYCTDGFCDLTGYSRTEIMCMGCACKFLVGIDTDKDFQSKIIRSLNSKTEMRTEILLYKKNGASFWCLLDLMPIRNEVGKVVLFLVSHKDVTKQKASIFDGRIGTNSGGNGFVSETSVPRLRKFSRDVLLHIQRQYGAKDSISKTRNTLSSSSVTAGQSSPFIPQYKLEHDKLPRLMVLHFGRPRLIWDWIILVLVCYIAIMVPFSVAFKIHHYTKELIIADTVIEFFFVVDIFINFRTTYVDKKTGRIIAQQKLIATNYLKGWFVVDFMAALPFEALYFSNHSLGFLVSLLKTGRLLRLFRIVRSINRYIEYTAALLGLLMFSFALIGHWFACIWYVIGYEELKNKEINGWLYGLGDQMGRPFTNSSKSGPSKGEAYISSLYFVLTSLTTVGFGNIAPNTSAEKIFSVVVLFLGALMQSAIFGNMTAIIQKMYSVRARFHAKANEIKQFIRLHGIDNDLKRRIEDFFLTHWSVSKGVDTDEMLGFFPNELRADICLHMYKNFLSLSCFSGTSRGCCRLLSLKVKRAFFRSGELIIKEKDAIDAIFFVNSGTIEIVQRDCIVAILGSGDLFGEDISRKFPVGKSNGDVRALTYCDLLYLTRPNFLGVLHLYPDFGETFSQKLEMTFNLGMEERNLSTCGPLDSITEGDEQYEESESTVENAQQECTLLNTSRDCPQSSPELPLWQRRIKDMENQKTSTSYIHEKKMLSSKNISKSFDNKITQQNRIKDGDGVFRFSGEMTENDCLNSDQVDVVSQFSTADENSMDISNEITCSQDISIENSDIIEETSFIDNFSLERVNDVDSYIQGRNDINSSKIVEKQSSRSSIDLLFLNKQSLDNIGPTFANTENTVRQQHPRCIWEGSNDTFLDKACSSSSEIDSKLFCKNQPTLRSEHKENHLDVLEHETEHLKVGNSCRFSTSESCPVTSSEFRENLDCSMSNFPSYDVVKSDSDNQSRAFSASKYNEYLTQLRKHCPFPQSESKQYLLDSEEQHDLKVKVVRESIEEMEESEKRTTSIFQIKEDIAESKRAIIEMMSKIDRIDNTLDDLHDDLSSIASLIPNIIEQKNDN